MSLFAPLMSPDATDDAPSAGQLQRDGRSNMFVVAALTSADASGPVRIRNLSSSGALVEGGALPAAGEPVRLNRGSLSVSGQIVWRREDKAGIKFSSSISVPLWLPTGRAPARQQRVDEIVFRYQAGAAPTAPALPRTLEIQEGAVDVRATLLELRAVINAAAEELASDSSLAARHVKALQAIDVAGQALEQLAGNLNAGASPPE